MHPGGAFFDHSLSFMMIRGGHVDLTIVGCFEVSCDGDLASWDLEEVGRPPAVGGAMDLVAGVKTVWVLTPHRTKSGRPRIVERCHLPLTGARVVDRIFTDIGVFDVTPKGLHLTAMVEGLGID